MLWPDGPPTRGPVIGDQPTTPSQDEGATGLPAGWHEIHVGDAVLDVLATGACRRWRARPGVCELGRSLHRLRAPAGVVAERVCNLDATLSLTVEVAPLSGVPASFLEPDAGQQWQPIITAQGCKGRLVRDRDTVVAYRFPQLDLWLQFFDGDGVDAQPEPIVDTISRVGNWSRGHAAICQRDGSRSRPARRPLVSPRAAPSRT